MHDKAAIVPEISRLPARLSAALAERFGARFATGLAVREQHGKDESSLPPLPPDAVVFAESTAEVAAVAALCHAERVPLIPYGTGTSLEGHLHAVRGGVCVDLSRMGRVLAIRPEDLDATVEAGVTRKALNAALHGTGLFFPIDPGADATLGGMAATRASGTNAVRYGTMRENTLGLEVVMADGRVIRTGGRARKSSAGYDLTRLMVGAEGTLGVITELTVRLYGIPQAISGGVCPFPDVDSACKAVIETVQMGVPVARIELINGLGMRAFNNYAKLGYPETPCLFVEFHGTDAGVKEEAETFGEIAAAHGGGPFRWTADADERNRLWKARHDAYWAGMTLRPGARALSTDVCVPISRLAECIVETEADIARSGLVAPIVGHVGDGNFHAVLLIERGNAAELKTAKAFARRMAERALRLGGTITGEHGVGMGKKDLMALEHGDAWEVMARIKRALDPDGILNPGKVVEVNQ